MLHIYKRVLGSKNMSKRSKLQANFEEDWQNLKTMRNRTSTPRLMNLQPPKRRPKGQISKVFHAKEVTIIKTKEAIAYREWTNL